MSNVRPCIANVTIHLAHDADVFVTVEQRVFFLPLAAWSAATEAGLVGLETRIREDDNQAPSVFIGRWDWDVLLCDELRERWRWERLSACHCDEDQLQFEMLC